MNKVHITPNIIPLLQKGSYNVTKQGDSVFVQVSDTKTDFSQNILSPIPGQNTSAKLEQLGIKNDILNFSIVLALKQMGMKITGEFVRIIRTIALKFPGKEKKAAEIAIVLKSKGINPTKELVQEILSELDLNFSNDSKGHEKSSHKAFQTTDEKQPENIFKDFLDSIPALSNKPGTFSVANSIKSLGKRSSDFTWIILPFDIINSQDLSKEGNGKLKILLDTFSNKATRLLISTDFPDSKYIFNITLSKGIITDISYSDGKSTETLQETERLQMCLSPSSQSPIPTRWLPYSDLEGLSEGTEKLTTLEAMV